MTALSIATVAVCTLATAVAALRWWRVAQREHYLAGAATRFALRWWRATPLNAALGLLGLVAGVSSIALHGAGLVAGVVALGAPLGLSVRGRTSALAWTRRLRTLAGGTTLVCAIAVVPPGVGAGLAAAGTALALSAMLLPLFVDLALFALAPLEYRLIGRYVTRATGIVRRVRPTVVAITGSYGKTSTKGYLAHLLADRFAVVASPKSFNNRAGLARTVNEHLVVGTEVLIAEMGTYRPGEIAALCSWLTPRISVITAIGPVHLERFKSLDRTLAAKSEIAASAEVVVLNVDDARLAGLAARLRAEGRRVIGASAGAPASGVVPGDVVVREEEGKLALEVDGELVGSVPLAAAATLPAATNAACAAAAALALGCRAEDLLSRLADLPVAENRLARSVTARGVVILDDTFNSNPAGARLALAELARNALPGGRRVVVTPGMVELGPLQVEENAALGAAIAAVASDLVVVARTNRDALIAGAKRAIGGGARCSVRAVADRQAAVEWVRATLTEGDVALYENDLPDHFP